MITLNVECTHASGLCSRAGVRRPRQRHDHQHRLDRRASRRNCSTASTAAARPSCSRSRSRCSTSWPTRACACRPCCRAPRRPTSGIWPACRCEHLPQEIVMSAQDMVDAALAGLAQGELVTIPALPRRSGLERVRERAQGLGAGSVSRRSGAALHRRLRLVHVGNRRGEKSQRRSSGQPRSITTMNTLIAASIQEDDFPPVARRIPTNALLCCDQRDRHAVMNAVGSASLAPVSLARTELIVPTALAGPSSPV